MPRVARTEDRRRGLTLLELVVVLVILAALGTVMITQTAGLTGEARYEQTVRTLERLQDAVIGRLPLASEDPTAVPPGFVADVGRLPQAGTALDMSELWDRTATASPPTAFAVQTLTGLDNDLQMACGWRGPYVRLPIGSDELRDGWGRSFDLAASDGAAVAMAGDNIAAITTTAPGGGGPFDQPLTDVIFEDTSATIDRTTGQVTLQLAFTLPTSPTGGSYAVVRLYGPVNGAAAVVAQSSASLGVAGATQSVTVTFTPADIPIGPKLLRAYQWNSATAPSTAADLTARTKSLALRVTILADGAMLPNLELEGQ
ncbi:MAG: prepilin-type N-terminal cleavage/methylation domain-containing protein [Planctomycetota bacterium]